MEKTKRTPIGFRKDILPILLLTAFWIVLHNCCVIAYGANHFTGDFRHSIGIDLLILIVLPAAFLRYFPWGNIIIRLVLGLFAVFLNFFFMPTY